MTQPTIVQVQTPYIKDVSLESPSSPAYFPQMDDPSVQEDINVQVRLGKLNEDHYEVAVTVTLTLKRETRSVFVLEVTQAGVFKLENVPEVDVSRVLHMACGPRVYDYLRVNFSDIGLRANLPPKGLPEIDWAKTWETIQANASPARAQEAANG